MRLLARALVLLVPSLVLAGGAAGAPAEDPKPYMAPWIVVDPGDPRIAHAHLPAAKVTPNSLGILLRVAPSNLGTKDAAMLVAGAARAGRRSGILLELPRTRVPTDPREAEATTAESLYPGLGALLSAARGADLFDLVVPELVGDLREKRFVLKRIASEIRAANPRALIAATAMGDDAPAALAALLSEETAAFVDLLGFTIPPSADPEKVRAEADRVAFGRPLLLHAPSLGDPDLLLAFAARFAPVGAPFVAAPLRSPPELDYELDRFAQLVSGDFGRDGRTARATLANGSELLVARMVSGTDLGGVVLIPGSAANGFLDSHSVERGVSLLLDAPTYATAEVVELATGRTKSFEIPRSTDPPRLALSLANGPIAVRLTARAKPPAEAAKATVGVSAERGLTAEEILARHQAWRAKRDARWSRLVATNRTSIRFRFADLNNTLDQTLVGKFFYEPGKGYDWAWSEAYFNGVRWRGKKIPELPLIQPEKVSELPLALTFNDSYRYVLEGEETLDGRRCYVLSFTPKASESDKPLYDGTVFVDTQDFAVIRTKARQLNLVGEVQSVDEASDFLPVPAPDGGEPMRFPTRITGQWILRTFSRTTVLERETLLLDVRLDPPTFEDEKKAAFASADVMVRDTEKGVRYLEKTKEGERVVVDDIKTSRLFGLGGVFYDSSMDYPLPLLGVYYLDLNFRKKHQQAQVFFGGVLLAASFGEPKLFGTKLNLGADVFGIAVQGTDALFIEGSEDEGQRVKQRSFAGNVNVGYPIGHHVKLSATVGITNRSYGDDAETDPAFTIPSDHWLTRLSGDIIWDVSGWALSARFGWNRRSRWDAWGFAGNPEYDPGKDEFRTYSVQLAKDFHFPGFQRIRSSVSYLGSSNTDRFSKYTFGFFGGTSLRGFRSGSLRAEEAFIGRGAYGLVFGDALRVEGIYEHAVVKDSASGLDWASFGGAGLSGQLPGPWSTLIQLDVGMPVVGRNRGQRGAVLNLVFLKIF